MRNLMRKARFRYGILCIGILGLEILIALFVHDRFIRPYGGDILVTVLLCCFCRFLYPKRQSGFGKSLPFLVFLFAFAVELAQYGNILEILGLADCRFLRILLGSTFSIADIFCYAVGCLLFILAEQMVHRSILKKR